MSSRLAASGPPTYQRTATVQIVSAQADWHAIEQRHNIKPKSLPQLGMEGHWLLDRMDAEGYQVVVHTVPPVARFILLHGFARAYRRRARVGSRTCRRSLEWHAADHGWVYANPATVPVATAPTDSPAADGNDFLKIRGRRTSRSHRTHQDSPG